MKKIIYLVLVGIVVVYLSCSDDSPKDVIYNIPSELDTLTQLNYLFEIRYIPLQDENVFLDQLSNVATVDKYGNFFFVGLIKQEIYKISNKGRIIKIFQAIGRGPGEYLFIASIKIDDNGNIYLADLITRKIVKLDSSFHYLNEFKLKSVHPIGDIEINSKGDLICYHPNDLEAPIWIYNGETGKLLLKFGKPDILSKKFHSSYGNSTLNIKDNNIFYMNSLKYEICSSNFAGELQLLIPSYSNHFIEIKKIVDNPMQNIRDYSIINSLILYKNYFFVGVNNVLIEENNVRSVTKFDIINKNGVVIKREIPFEDYFFLKKLDEKRFFSISYKDSSNSENPCILIYTIKI